MKKFIIYKYSKNTQEIDKKITKNIDINASKEMAQINKFNMVY